MEGEKPISIGEVERNYINSFYALKDVKTNQEKIQSLRNHTGYNHFHCEGYETMTPAQKESAELKGLELALIADMVA